MCTFVAVLNKEGTYFSRNLYTIGVEKPSPVPSSPTNVDIASRELSERPTIYGPYHSVSYFPVEYFE